MGKNVKGILGKEVTVDSFQKEIVFLVGGHLYGSSRNTSGFPSSTFIANIDSINNAEIDFFVSLGDLFSNLEKDFVNYNSKIFPKINFPFFNAVGNHDVFDYEMYHNYFGKTYDYFEILDNAFFILDSEFGDLLNKEQINFVKKKFNDLNQKEVKNIFFFSHRPIWIDDISKIKEIFTAAESPKNSLLKNEISVQLEHFPGANIYWFSGSMGGANQSYFYHKEDNHTFILNAIRDRNIDGFIKILINEHGKVDFETFSLTSKKLSPLNFFNIDYWGRAGSTFDIKSFMQDFYYAVTHRYFIFGILTGLLGVFLKKS